MYSSEVHIRNYSNVYSVDLLDVDTHQEQFIWLLAIFAIWITVFVMSNNLIVLFFC